MSRSIQCVVVAVARSRVATGGMVVNSPKRTRRGHSHVDAPHYVTRLWASKTEMTNRGSHRRSESLKGATTYALSYY